MKKIIIILCCVVLFIQCEKGVQEDNLYIRGRAFLVDTLTQYSNGTPIANKRVTISKAGSDSLNYLYSDSTDNSGYFTFPVLADDKTSSFVVRYEDSSKGYFYKGSAPAKTGNEAVVLKVYLDPAKQNSIILTLIDDQNQPLPKANVRLYANQTLANLNDSTGAGAIQTFLTNEYGLVYKFNLPPGKYFLNADKKVDTISYQRISKTVVLGSTGFVIDTMGLKRVQVPVTNGFQVTITDSTGGTIPTASVNVYTSPVLAQINDPSGAIAKLVSDQAGVVKKNNLPVGAYYLSATKTVDTIQLVRPAKLITLPINGIVADSMVIRKKN